MLLLLPRRRYATRPDRATPAARATVCLASGRCRFPFGSPYAALSPKNKNRSPPPLPPLPPSSLYALCFAFVSFFLALNPNTAHGIVCFCFLGLLPTQLLLLLPFACPFCLAASHLCIRLPRDLAGECEPAESERASVCTSVCLCVCECAWVCVRHLNIVCARNFIHKTCVAFAASFCFLFRVVVAAVVVRAKKSRSRCPPVSPSVRPPACHLPVSKTAQNPCRFLSLPSFAAREAASAAAPTARPCNGYLNVCADTQRTCVSR